ncbi:MAG: hypothetical protein HY270_00140 [Deltaproteobacteria bacterium]|nr:hypothetical protein [Deltaproteobacteria bacterium]
MHRYVKMSEVVATLHIDAEFVRQLEEEDLVHIKQSSEGEPVLSSDDFDRVRLARLLISELDVNLPGVEVVMHMRDSMLAAQRQFHEILDAVIAELRQRRD